MQLHSERHFPGGGMMVRPRLSTLSVTQPSGRDCHSDTRSLTALCEAGLRPTVMLDLG